MSMDRRMDLQRQSMGSGKRMRKDESGTYVFTGNVTMNLYGQRKEMEIASHLEEMSAADSE